MEELLREAFKLGQQWVKDINDEKEPVSFTEWFSKCKVAINYTRGCTELPSNKELHSAYNDAVLKNHKTLDELNKEYIKLGFLYYHKYLQLKRMK